MLQKILSELKVVIDHTENNWSTDKLFWCYKQLEKYADESFPLGKPVKPACEMERPKLENFLPGDTTTDMVNNMFLENNELYNYINALDHYIDHLESKSV